MSVRQVSVYPSNMFKWFVIFGLVFLVSFAHVFAEEVEQTSLKFPVVQETLSNGLRVVMSPDSSVPTVAIAVYYDVGSRNEVKGRTGFAHLFEHMMFQGSANIGKMEHFEYIVKRGGSANGTTSVDRTNYYETLPSNELELGLWLESDRMRSLAINESNFENQRSTVKEERRQRIDNQPYVPSMLKINELAYGGYFPYAHSTIGDMADLDAAVLSDVKAFFDSYYPPNNAVLSIVGDFEPEQALELVKKYFGTIKSRKVPKYTPPDFEPRKESLSETMVDELAQLPAMHVAVSIPPSRTEDHYPLELLAMILGHGKSSHLYRALVKEKELCQQVSVSTDDRRGPDLFSIWAVLSKGATGDKVREEIKESIRKIVVDGISERELQKVKNVLQSGWVFGLQSNLSRAMYLAEFELYWGDANLLNSELEKYLDVTAEQVQRVAKQYLMEQPWTVLDVIPKNLTAESPKK